ncbi:MAG: bifunctional nicotinamidase/pyrazinamidase [Gammaproteobacteria bacterium]|nr:bifunctional nicotinamidase/pyrazinamidase [Gammaproteobacteria bacterium]
MTSDDCLLIIDVQNDFCGGGALEVPDADSVVGPINTLINQFSTVVLTQDWHPAGHSSFASTHSNKSPFDTVSLPYGEQTLWPDHCVQGSDGAAFHTQLDVNEAHLVIRKGFRPHIDSYSAFFENDRSTTTGLTGYLKERDIKHVHCVGLALDFCVRYSAEDAIKQGFETTVLSHCCRGIDMNGSVADSIQAMTALGVSVV